MEVTLTARQVENFHAKYVVNKKTKCWEWTAAKTFGYGTFGAGGKTYRAHRVSYFLFRGPIAKGEPLDHLCRNPGCVNPAHLEAVTHQENLLRGDTLTAKNAGKTHCYRGHEFSDENTYWSKKGHRRCRECGRLDKAAYVAANRTANNAYQRGLRAKNKKPGPGSGCVHKVKTHCPHGHAYDEKNTRIRPNGARECRACDRERARAYYRKRRVCGS